jgi:hypothetical protein
MFILYLIIIIYDEHNELEYIQFQLTNLKNNKKNRFLKLQI